MGKFIGCVWDGFLCDSFTYDNFHDIGFIYVGFIYVGLADPSSICSPSMPSSACFAPPSSYNSS